MSLAIVTLVGTLTGWVVGRMFLLLMIPVDNAPVRA